MIFKKILNFFDKSEPFYPKYGNLYKLKNEALPFRYIFARDDDRKGIHRFKLHKLKEYVFYNLDEVEREANSDEIRIYNIIKNHVNKVAENS